MKAGPVDLEWASFIVRKMQIAVAAGIVEGKCGESVAAFTDIDVVGMETS
jgi:hypothetical protein